MLAQNYAEPIVLAKNYAEPIMPVQQYSQANAGAQFPDLNGLKKVAETAVSSAKEASKETVEKVQDQTKQVTDKIDDKDKEAIKQQGVAANNKIQGHANDALKNTSSVLNSPEANIIGAIAGPKVQEKLDTAKNIVSDALKSPAIVG